MYIVYMWATSLPANDIIIIYILINNVTERGGWGERERQREREREREEREREMDRQTVTEGDTQTEVENKG